MTEPTAEVHAQPGDAADIRTALHDIVDLLLPLLRPYEAAFYVHLFRHSWGDTGQPLVRTTYRSLRTEVVRTNWRRADFRYSLGANSVRIALGGLATLGAIRRQEVARNAGAVYRIFLPREIEACRQRLEAAKAASAQPTSDFYNVRANRRKVYERDGYTCRYCGTPVTPYTATLDHLVPMVAGGTNGIDNLVTACLSCNTRKGKKPLGDFLAEQNPA
jgi:HNH endonuclease